MHAFLQLHSLAGLSKEVLSIVLPSDLMYRSSGNFHVKIIRIKKFRGISSH